MALPDFTQLANKFGWQFRQPALLEQALTHRSYLNEHPEHHLKHNERLEFLGDAVLELVVTEFLFARYPEAPEGELTAYRAALVNADTLGDLAAKLGVNDFLLLSRGEAKDTGRARQIILANTMEAIIGALFLDQSYSAVKDFVATQLLPLVDKIVAEASWQDAKSYFQERAQEQTGVTPTYQVLNEQGPDHDKIFTVGVFLNTEQVAVGTGPSKQRAEQEAAAAGLRAKGWQH